MPDFSALQIPPPANWQDFEVMCRDLWGELWDDPNTQRNGRSGQEQHGVDVWGRPNRGSDWAGIQCKGKDNYQKKKVTEKELLAEINKAKKFSPRLSEWILATTGPKDARIEQKAREITQAHLEKGLFSVSVFGWQDIQEILAQYPSLIRKHYPSLTDIFSHPSLEGASRQREWSTSVVPIEDNIIGDAEESHELAEEFYQGISARYKHILAGLDVNRPQKLQEIANGFKQDRVVILHGTSGQGKTTLAYRYLHEYCSQYSRFQIRSVASLEHVFGIAQSLTAHADASSVTLVVYLDVSARDRDWPEMVKQLSYHHNILVLVTIREEDWRRSNVSGVEMKFSTVELTFERQEAEKIYEALTAKAKPVNVLNFSEAWSKFGESGPLMEFIHLITQGSSLRERLSQQVSHLENGVREGRFNKAEIELLRLTSVASAFEAKMQAKPLAKHLGLPAPQATLKLFEKEYLLRMSEDSSLVGGLHPIRSMVLSDILSDPTFTPWSESAATCLPFIEEQDIETFLLYSFSRRSNELGELLGTLAEYQPRTWTAIAGVVRALIWLGASNYVEANRELIKEAAEKIGQGWALFLDYDLANLNKGIGAAWWKTLDGVIPDSGKELLEKMHARQSDKNSVIERVSSWMNKRAERPASPMTEAEWEGASEAIFWANHLSVDWPLEQWLSEDELDRAIDSLPLEKMANLILAITASKKFSAWLEARRKRYIGRFRRETLCVALEDDGRKATTRFVFDLNELNETSPENLQDKIHVPKDRFHWEALRRIELLRRLLPDREEFASQGYGHLLWENFLPHDETIKTGIARSYLPPIWLTSVNATFGGIGNQMFRPATWAEYVESLLDLRRSVIRSLKQLERGLEIYFRRQHIVQLLGLEVDEEEWDRCKKMLNEPPLLPRVAVDEWGFVNESTATEVIQRRSDGSSLIARNGLAVQRYKPFLKAFGEYTRTLSNYFFKAKEAMTLLPHMGRGGGSKTDVLEKAQQLGMDTRSPLSTTHDLAEAVKNLSQLQCTSRLILEPYFNSHELDKLDEEEHKVFNRVWNMWYFFAFHPKKVMQNAAEQCAAEPVKLFKNIRLALRQKLRRLSVEGVTIQIAAEDILWEQEPALWLTISTHHAWDVYNALGNALTAIKDAVRNVRDDKLRQYVLEFHWPFVVIVPLVRGRYITPLAWRLRLSLISDDEVTLNWWNLAQQAIPPDALRHLGLQAWDKPQLNVGVNLHQSTSILFQLAAHIRDFLRLPELDDEGGTYLQQYVTRLNNQLSTAMQAVIDTEVAMLDVINDISFEELESRPSLIDTGQALSELHKRILPTVDFEMQAVLTLEELAKWSERLQEAPIYALMALHAWTSDVLDQTEIDPA